MWTNCSGDRSFGSGEAQAVVAHVELDVVLAHKHVPENEEVQFVVTDKPAVAGRLRQHAQL